jgi:hypothetical protein
VGTPSVLTDPSRAVGCLAAMTGRTIHLVSNDDNCAGLLINHRTADGKYPRNGTMIIITPGMCC